MAAMLDRVKAYLRAHRHEWPDICRATGLKESWMAKVADGRIPDPGVIKIQKVDDYRRARQRRRRVRNGTATVPATASPLPSHH